MATEIRPRLLSVREACKWLNLCRQIFWAARKAGLLEWVPIGAGGTGVRFTEEQLERFARLYIEKPEYVRRNIARHLQHRRNG
jgi:hypothetical protein